MVFIQKGNSPWLKLSDMLCITGSKRKVLSWPVAILLEPDKNWPKVRKKILINTIGIKIISRVRGESLETAFNLEKATLLSWWVRLFIN